MRPRLSAMLLLSLLGTPVAAEAAQPPAAQPAAAPGAATGGTATAKAPAAQDAGTGKQSTTPSVAPDKAREKAIADMLVHRVRPDQVVWLDVEGGKVLALYDGDIKGKPRGTAIILHGMEANPDMEGVVHALRTRLVDHGWSTLSVQLPVLPPGSPAAAYGGTLEAAGKRLQAAMSYLKGKQPGPVVLVGYELGALVALRGAASAGTGIAAVAALDLSGTRDLVAPAEVDAMLGKLHMPVLDLYGALDSASRLELAPPRKASARKAGNAQFRQEKMAGADGQFTGMAPSVARHVRAWLDKMMKGKSAPP